MKIFVKVKSRASKNIVEKKDDNIFLVSTTETPTKGRANKAVTKLLARSFGVASSRVSLISGFSSKQKVFNVEFLQLDEIK